MVLWSTLDHADKFSAAVGLQVRHFAPLPWRGDNRLPAGQVPYLKGPWHPRRSLPYQYPAPADTWRQACTYTCAFLLRSLRSSLEQCQCLLSAGCRYGSEILRQVNRLCSCNSWHWFELVSSHEKGFTLPGPAAIIDNIIGYRIRLQNSVSKSSFLWYK